MGAHSSMNARLTAVVVQVRGPSHPMAARLGMHAAQPGSSEDPAVLERS